MVQSLLRENKQCVNKKEARRERLMRMYDLIMKKKHGQALTEAEIRFFVNGYTKGEIPDYQMSAFLMAVCFRGMDEKETLALTMAMAESGEITAFSFSC